MHAKGFDHVEPVQTERNSELRMAGDLKHEAAVPTLIDELVLRQAPDRKSAENERSGVLAEILRGLLTIDVDQLDAPGSDDLLLNDKLAVRSWSI